MTITIETWAFPLLATLGCMIYVSWPVYQKGYYFEFTRLARCFVSTIVILAAWLIWALLR